MTTKPPAARPALPSAAPRAPRLLTPHDLARYLGVTPRTLRNWERDGTGPRRIMLAPTTPRYHPRDVQAWLQSRAES